jgi:alkylated DNA repair dioxygenase AlkB
MTNTQFSLFDETPMPAIPAMPSGFRYQPDLISAAEEAALVREIKQMTMTPYEFRGFLARRNVAAFGYRYSYRSRKMERAPAMTAPLLALREQVAAFAGRAPEEFQQLLVTEYAPGVPIAWHRDRLQYGEIAGVSLLSPALFRLRKRQDDKWLRAARIVAPRSAYLLSGESRMDWEHSIPDVEQLRYSLTFRTLV